MRFSKKLLCAGTLLTLLTVTGCKGVLDVFEYVKAPEAPSITSQPKNIMYFSNYIIEPPKIFKEKISKVKGIYVTSTHAGIDKYLQKHIDFCVGSGVNAMVIDVRTEAGFITFQGMPTADELGVSVNDISDIKEVLIRIKENGIYPIARMVAFKDNNTYNFKPELYIKNPDGSIWFDNNDEAWLNPYNSKARDYVLQFAEEAVELGFEEIQFDYMRFAASSKLENADMGKTNGLTRTEIITVFAKEAMETLGPMGAKISADVYGAIINSDTDAEIVGQDYVELARLLDVICPMIYPSHYANGSMGLDIPDLLPYDTIYKSMKLSNERLDEIPNGEHRAIVRPWLQDFTASWLNSYLEYAGDERGAQIQGAYDAGLSEWLLWDPWNKYEMDGINGNARFANINMDE
ncbi:MAG: putative glycoside hydrolase [Clostridiales bacterium]|jgi:hypothetical protein|nr:putative glycoside hydrolase [Clostridiales bacterium]